MKFSLYASVAAFAMTASLAQAEAHLPFAKGEGDFNWESLDAFAAEHDLNGEEISIFGPWRGDDQGLVESIIDYFEEATGAEVSYASSESYEQQIVIDTEAGSPPNVAVLPQPGLIQDLVSKGFVEPLSDDTQAWLKENYAAGESWVSLGTFTGPDGEDRLYAFPYKIDLKSLVWYSPDNFDDAGYEVPETMEELKALTEQIVADGETPGASDWDRGAPPAGRRPTGSKT